jgi:hypothetical protein
MYKWQKNEDQVMRRVSQREFSGWLEKRLTIEEGTRGFIFQDGKLVGETGSGRLTISGLKDRLANMDFTTKYEVLLVDGGIVPLEMTIPACRTESALHVDVTATINLQFEIIENFIAVFKASDQLSRKQLAEKVAPLFESHLRPFIAGLVLADLFKKPHLKETLIESIEDTFQKELAAMGFLLKGVGLMKFSSQDYTKVEDQERELGHLADEARFLEQRNNYYDSIRKLISTDRLREFRDEKEFEESLKSLNHEYKIKDVLRDKDLKELTQELITTYKENQGDPAAASANLEKQVQGMETKMIAEKSAPAVETKTMAEKSAAANDNANLYGKRTMKVGDTIKFTSGEIPWTMRLIEVKHVKKGLLSAVVPPLARFEFKSWKGRKAITGFSETVACDPDHPKTFDFSGSKFKVRFHSAVPGRANISVEKHD